MADGEGTTEAETGGTAEPEGAASATIDDVKRIVGEAVAEIRDAITGGGGEPSDPVDPDDGVGDDGGEDTRLSIQDVERVAEEKVKVALAKLNARKPKAKAPATPATPEPEVEPVTPARKAWRERIWGAA